MSPLIQCCTTVHFVIRAHCDECYTLCGYRLMNTSIWK